MIDVTTGYDKKVRHNFGGILGTVGITLYSLSISEFSEKSTDFIFDTHFRLELKKMHLGKHLE